ncbi:MAG: hypothetical protein AB8B64_08970 [Granulosicoccus sp.]
MHSSFGLLMSVSLLLGSTAIANTSVTDASAGVLDLPQITTTTTPVVSTPPPAVTVFTSSPEVSNTDLQADFAAEQSLLRALPLSELEALAEQGDRAAQLTLAEIYAQEAALLSYAPEAAAQALSDAASLISRAAEAGFPGTPTLDRVGVKFFPMRAPREP